MSLRKNLVVAFLVFALGLLTVTLIPFGVVSVHGHLRSFIDAESLDAQRTASVVARSADPKRALSEHYEGPASAAWLLDTSGSTVAEPTNRQVFPARVTRAPEVEAARRGTTATRITDTPDGRRLLIATPTFKAGRLNGVVWASVTLAPVRREDRETWAQLAAIGTVVMIIAAMVGVFLSRRIARRLEIVAAGAKRFGEGHLGETIEVGGRDEITALASTLNTMGAEIDRLVHREKDFVAAASHQIRTPLTAIKIRIDELLATNGTHDVEETEYLKEMAEEVDRLTMLTTRLLDLSSAEAHRDARPLPAAFALREAIDRIEPLAHHFGISIDLDVQTEDVQIQAAPGAFEEALFNVLDNAVKYSPPGEAVEVSAAREDGRFVVHVSDRGSGIATEQRARVLEPFYRATRTKTGYGLGLAISARLCAGAGATLELDKRRGGGTTATISWPVES